VGVAIAVTEDQPQARTIEPRSAHYTAPELLGRPRRGAGNSAGGEGEEEECEEEEEEEDNAFRPERRLKGDMYSVGWVLAELWFEKDLPYKPAAYSGDSLPPRLDWLIEQCLDDDWRKRLSAAAALNVIEGARREWWVMIAKHIEKGKTPGLVLHRSTNWKTKTSSTGLERIRDAVAALK
jgi:hypothetical protein